MLFSLVDSKLLRSVGGECWFNGYDDPMSSFLECQMAEKTAAVDLITQLEDAVE